MADVTITVGADVSGLEAAVTDGVRAVGRLDRAADKLQASGRAASALAGIDQKAKALNKTGQLLGGTFGQIGGSLDDLNDLLQMGELRTAAMVGGVGALVATVAGLGVEVVNTTANVRQMFDGLSADRQRLLSDTAKELGRSADAMADAGDAATALRIAFAGLFSETTGDAARGLAAGLDTITGAVLAIKSSGALDTLSQMVGLLARAGVLGPAGTVAGAASAALSALGAGVERAADAAAAAGGSDVGIPASLARSSFARGGAAASAAAAPSGDFTFSQTAADVEIGVDRAALAAEFAYRVQLHKEYQEKLTADAKLAEEARLRNEELAAQQSEAMLRERMSTMGQVAGALSGVLDGIFSAYQASIAATNDATVAEQKRAFESSKDAAQAQAVISAALAAIQITASLAGTGPAAPVLIALGVAGVAAAAAANIATIEAQEFTPRHRGGMIDPDERLMPSGVLARDNEAVGVFTRQGFAAVGGAAGLSAINAGMPPRLPDIYLVVDGQPRPARSLARPTPGYGQPRSVR